MATPVVNELWTVNDLAAWLRMTPMAVRAMLRRRELPPAAIIKIGRRVRIRVDVIREWVNRKQTA